MEKSTWEIINELKQHKVIKAIPELNELVKELSKNRKKEDKQDKKWHELIQYCAEGLSYEEAFEIVKP